jgi:hypothetical protein
MQHLLERMRSLIRPLAVAAVTLALLAPAAAVTTPVTRANGTAAPCTNWESLITPPETIRVLRTRTGVVEVVDFRTYVYRTHVAEFWSEYLSQPYSNTLLGAGAVAIRQNAWGWTMTARNWWAQTAYTAAQERWVRDDYADDNALNGSAGNSAWSRQRRATENAAIALEMRIRLGADLQDDGVGGLEWDARTSTWTAPLAEINSDGSVDAPNANSDRSCFDVTDHPSINQYYTRGGIYEPGYSSGSTNNARYNAAVDATWGLTMQRYYADDDEWRFWRPGFYGSFTVTRECLSRPEPGDRNVQMRHPSQPSHYRGWSFFPVNADDCVRSQGYTVEALLREMFYAWDADLVAGGGTSSLEDDRYNINSVTPIRLLTPGGDLTGDARGDILAFSPAGALKIVSADPNVNALGQLNGRSAGSVKLGEGEKLISRSVGRVLADGAAAILDLRRDAGGSVSLISTPFVDGVAKRPTTQFSNSSTFDPEATLEIFATDTSHDGIEEVFITERIPGEPNAAGEPATDNGTIRLYSVPLDATEATQIAERSEAGRDARALVGDLDGDGATDVLFLWRSVDGSLASSTGIGEGSPPLTPWSVGSLSEPGALLWPVASGWQGTLGDLNGDGIAELHLRNADPSNRIRIHTLTLDVRGDGELAAVDKEYVAQVKPAESTKVRAGERTLALVAARAKVSLPALLALNSGPSYKVTILPNDTYTKIAARLKVSEPCLRSMNGNKTLVRGKKLNAPYDLCVYSASSVMFRQAPVRIAHGEFDWLVSGDTWEKVATRAVARGIEATPADLEALNSSVLIGTATPGLKVRVRTPWAPLARTLPPAGPISASNASLTWSDPAVATTLAVGATAPQLAARDWDGDGIDELLFLSPPGSSSLLITPAGLTDGRLTLAASLTRTGIVTGWSLR